MIEESKLKAMNKETPLSARDRATKLVFKIVQQWGNAIGPSVDDFVDEMLSIAASATVDKGVAKQ